MPLKYFFITIKFHPNDVNIFEDFIAQLLGLIEDDTKIWCIEKDNTPDRHFHAVVSNKIKDKEYKDRHNFKQLLVPRLKTYLKKVFNHTEVDNTARTKAINISDMLDESYRNKDNEDKIGYCAKDFTLRCGGNISAEDKEKHKLIYLNSKKITENTIKNTLETKTITIKTAITYMYDFFIQYKPPIKCIYSQMVENGFSFSQMSNNQKDSVRNELKLRLYKEDKLQLTKHELEHTRQDIDNINHKDIYEEHEQLKSELENLLILAQINKSDINSDDIRKLIS